MGKRRRNEYLAGDFINESTTRKPETLKDVVEKKINLLYDFHILKKKKENSPPDPLEHEVRAFLTALGARRVSVESAEHAMTSALHDVIRFEKTLIEMLDGR
jgi:hypothetical protein